MKKTLFNILLNLLQPKRCRLFCLNLNGPIMKPVHCPTVQVPSRLLCERLSEIEKNEL